MLTLLLAMATAFAAVIERPMTSLVPDATITVGHDPDWMVVTPRAVWVTTASANQVTEIVATTNHVGLVVTVNKPCSGLAAGFGSIWIPSCGDHSLLRVDQRSGRVIATIAAGPATRKAASPPVLALSGSPPRRAGSSRALIHGQTELLRRSQSPPAHFAHSTPAALSGSHRQNTTSSARLIPLSIA